MFLHDGTNRLICSIVTVVNIKNLKTISNVQIPALCIATRSTQLTCKCIATTPCILKVKINELITIQNPQLVMLPTVHV